MKIHSIVRSFVLSAALLAPAFAIQPSPLAVSEALVPLNSNPVVSKGMSRETVDFMLGKPDARLSADVWVYWNFKAKGVPGGDAGDTLIVKFTDDRVTLLRLSRSEPVRAFIAQAKARALEQSLAAH
ncbi:MAG: hypothetical protein ABIZ81_00165 [Opitutaceae bacterium]